MKIIFLTSQQAAEQATYLVSWLRNRGHIVSVTKDRITPEGLVSFDIGISFGYRYIFKKIHIDALKGKLINVHTGFLPYGRGAMPNVWAIIDRVPAGVSIHFVDEGIDTGPIIAQFEIPVLATDTGATLYRRLRNEAFHLFMKVWPVIEGSTRIPGGAQPPGEFITHKSGDVGLVDDLDNYFGPLARRVIDVLRARTFPDHEAAYIHDEDGRKVFVRVELQYEEETPTPP